MLMSHLQENIHFADVLTQVSELVHKLSVFRTVTAYGVRYSGWQRLGRGCLYKRKFVVTILTHTPL